MADKKYKFLTIKAKKKNKPKPKPTPKQVAVRFKKGSTGNPNGRPTSRNKTLLTRVREMLKEKALDDHGKLRLRSDIVANSFIEQMEKGSFVHLKEFIDREEGKVAQRVADADGNNLKMYVNLPLDDEEEAP